MISYLDLRLSMTTIHEEHPFDISLKRFPSLRNSECKIQLISLFSSFYINFSLSYAISRIHTSSFVHSLWSTLAFRSIFCAYRQLLGTRIRQCEFGVDRWANRQMDKWTDIDGWMDGYPSKRREERHHHRWSGRYTKPARRVGARFHRNLRTCRLLPSTMTLSLLSSSLSFLPCILYASMSYACSTYLFGLSLFFGGKEKKIFIRNNQHICSS